MIEAEWKSYESEVLPRDAGAVQRDECRRAFYAGAHAAFVAVMSSEGDLATLEGIKQELLEFVRSIG